MATSFAALIFRPAVVPDRALSQGFAIALAGWDVPSPRLLVAPLPGVSGWSAAFYSGGAALAGDDELEHWCELFEDELSPAACVVDATAELGQGDATVYTLIFSDELVHDEAYCVDMTHVRRQFLRDGDEGLEAGIETHDRSESVVLDFDAEPSVLAPHRGSTFLSAALGAPLLPALVGALFAADRRVPVRLVEEGAEAIADETRRLNRVFGRTSGREAFAPPEVPVVPPASYVAFVQTYDWADPSDPSDLYRGLAIGAIEGVLRFLRPAEIVAASADPSWAAAAGRALYPLARLLGSALGGASAEPIFVGLGADGAALFLVSRTGRVRAAGPTFAELLRYLSLGWSKRSDPEEDLIGALMLRAKLRSETR